MKKILIICGGLQIGGAERVAANISKYAPEGQYEFHYLVFEGNENVYGPEIEARGGKVFTFPSPSGGYGRYIKALKQLIKTERYDVVHSHTMFNSGINLSVAKSCRVPIRIAHSHSIRGFEKRGFLKNLYEKTMRLLILRSATHCVGCGQSAGEWLFGKKAFAKRGILIYNGIALSDFSFDPVKRDKLRAQLAPDMKCPFIIGHAGHLAPVKNQSFLIELMPAILEQNPNALLLLLGEGNDRAMLEQKAQALNVAHRVLMPGNVSNVGDYLSAMDIFAFPSLYEGMPLALIEAQAAGLPCVISDKIPGDAALTDLVERLPLSSTKEWISSLCSAPFTQRAAYSSQLNALGLDTMGMLSKIYTFYEGKR